jgi:chemotaxis regulatin CheY-phosphate phosphatase CheZ
MKTLQVGEVSEAMELLMMAQNYQDQIDLITGKITRLLGGVKDDIIHEIVDQAVLNKESLNWIVEEVKDWENYRLEHKVTG